MLDKASLGGFRFFHLCSPCTHVLHLGKFPPQLLLRPSSLHLRHALLLLRPGLHHHPEGHTEIGLSVYNAGASLHLWRCISWAHLLAFHFQSIQFWDDHSTPQIALWESNTLMCGGERLAVPQGIQSGHHCQWDISICLRGGCCCPVEPKILSSVSSNEDLVAFCNLESGFWDIPQQKQ